MELPPVLLSTLQTSPLALSWTSVDVLICHRDSLHTCGHSLNHLSASLQSSRIFRLQRSPENQHSGFPPDDHPATPGSWNLFIPVGDQPCLCLPPQGGQDCFQDSLLRKGSYHLVPEVTWFMGFSSSPGNPSGPGLREP